MEALLNQLSQTVAVARSVEGLARPLLEMLETVTGLESAYLTTIDLDQGIQRVLYARNSVDLNIPEGMSVPWQDTLCRRALEEGRPCVTDVGTRWADSRAAAALGIQTYMSTPVHTDDGGLFGTLCAAGLQCRQQSTEALRVMELFARLISVQIERERLVQQLLEANAQLTAHAATDVLTGLHNRRSLLEALHRLLAQGSRDNTTVLIGFVDLDGFKEINDTHGHGVGDLFLAEQARRLQHMMRAQDFVARHGGDEFVVISAGPTPGEAVEPARLAFAQRMTQATAGHFECGPITLNYPGASVGAVAIAPHSLNVNEALLEADRAMYAVKQARRALAGLRH